MKHRMNEMKYPAKEMTCRSPEMTFANNEIRDLFYEMKYRNKEMTSRSPEMTHRCNEITDQINEMKYPTAAMSCSTAAMTYPTLEMIYPGHEMMPGLAETTLVFNNKSAAIVGIKGVCDERRNIALS